MDIKVKSQKKLKLETHFFRYIFFIGCPVCWQLNKYQTKKKRSSNKQPLRCSLAGAVEPIFKAPSETQTWVPTPLAVLNHLHWRDTSIQESLFHFPREPPKLSFHRTQKQDILTEKGYEEQGLVEIFVLRISSLISSWPYTCRKSEREKRILNGWRSEVNLFIMIRDG